MCFGISIVKMTGVDVILKDLGFQCSIVASTFGNPEQFQTFKPTVSFSNCLPNTLFTPIILSHIITDSFVKNSIRHRLIQLILIKNKTCISGHFMRLRELRKWCRMGKVCKKGADLHRGNALPGPWKTDWVRKVPQQKTDLPQK
jgi:hypothetical protein